MLQENASKSSLHASGVVECFSEDVADLLFQPERCIISKAASQLMKLVHEALKVYLFLFSFCMCPDHFRIKYFLLKNFLCSLRI